jgi:hypothetical protein
MKYKYKYKNRPLRILKDKNNLPYIKFKNKNISLKGYNINEIIKIIKKMTKPTKKKKLEPQEQRRKKEQVNKYVSDAIESTISEVKGKQIPVFKGSIQEDTEKIKNLTTEIEIFKNKISNKSDNIFDNKIKKISKSLKSIEYIKDSKQKFKDFINYDKDTNKYSIKFNDIGIIYADSPDELKEIISNIYKENLKQREDLENDKLNLNNSLLKLDENLKKVKKDKVISENEKNLILWEKEKLSKLTKQINEGLKLGLDKVRQNLNIPSDYKTDTKYNLYSYAYDRDNPKPLPQEIPEDEQEGEGNKVLKGGLWTNQINKIMEVNKYYIDTIANNELDEILNYIYNNNILKGSFIMNTLNTYDKSVGHWVAIYYDVSNNGEYTLEYYDPFGNDPENNKLISKFKKLFEKIGIDVYVKVKINKIKQQSITSSNCGWFSIKFLLERLNGISFKDATKYKKISNNEDEIKEIKNHYNKYGFI